MNKKPTNPNLPPQNSNSAIPRKRQRPQSLFANRINLEQVYAPAPTFKYVVIKINDEVADHTFEKVNSFKLTSEIRNVIGDKDFRDIKKLRNGTLLVKAANDNQADKLLKITTLCSQPVTIFLHKQLNTSKGVVSCYDLMINSVDEIKEELASQGVTEVYRITSRRGGSIQPTPTLILTFSTTKLPSDVFAGFHKLSVREYIPNPLRCFKCQRFGHSKVHCKGKNTCVTCSLEFHGEEPCTSGICCANCKGEHAASSKECPMFNKEKKIQELIVKEGISINEARKRLENFFPARTVTPTMSFSAAAASTPAVTPKHVAELENLRQENIHLLKTNNDLLQKLTLQDTKIDKLQNTIEKLLEIMGQKITPVDEPTANEEEMDLSSVEGAEENVNTTKLTPPLKIVKLHREKKIKSTALPKNNDSSNTPGFTFFLKDKTPENENTEATSKSFNKDKERKKN